MIQFKEERLFGRYITFEHITPILYEYGFIPELLGESVNKVPIYMYKLGTGPKSYYFGLKCTVMRVPLLKRLLIS